MKKLLIAIGAFLGLVGVGVVAANSLEANALYTTENCGSSAIVKCGIGTGSTSDSQKKLNARITSSGKAVFNHYGISTNLSSAKTGTLYTNGDIKVDGKVVAKGARSVGRVHRPSSTTVTIGGVKYYHHPASVAFPDNTPVFVFFDKYGRYTGAIAKVCGNPIIATPTQPAPKVVCNGLTVDKLSRTKFTFKVSASATNGAKITGYTFNFGDGTSKKQTSNTITHDFSKTGSFTVKVTVHNNVKDITDSKCSKKVNVEKPPVKPTAACKSLTATALSRTNHKLSATATVSGGATISAYRYVVTNAGGATVLDRTVSTTGTSSAINTGDLAAGTYKAKVTVKTSAGDKTGADCETTFTIKKAPVAACTGLTATISNRTNVALNATASASNGATISAYVFTIVNNDGQTVFNRTVSSSATSASTNTTLEAGSYTAKVVVKTSEGDKTGPACETQIKVEKEKVPGVKVQKLVNGVKYTRVAENVQFTYQLKVTNTGETKLTNVKVTDTPPRGVTLLQGDRGTITNNVWTYTIPELTVGESTNFTLTAKVPVAIAGMLKNTVCVDAPEVPGNPDDCDTADVDVTCPVPGKEEYPVGSPECKEVPPAPEKEKVCELDTGKIITINKDDFDGSKHSRDLSDCEKTPEVPKELPQTGAGSVVLSGLGLGSLIAGIGYYVASRRSL